MFAHFFEGVWFKVFLAGASFALGGLAEWLRRKWRLRCERREIECGQRHHTIDFVAAFVTEHDGKKLLHVHELGSLPLELFFPIQHAREALIHRSNATDSCDSVVPMHGALGSFILRELHGQVRMVAPKSDFPTDHWVMVPIFETYSSVEFATPTVLLVRESDLKVFENFATCRELQVQYGDHGAKVLTLLEVKRKFDQQCAEFNEARRLGKTTKSLEEMWVIPLRLDVEPKLPNPELVARGAVRPFRSIPWERYAKELTALKLQSQ